MQDGLLSQKEDFISQQEILLSKTKKLEYDLSELRRENYDQKAYIEELKTKLQSVTEKEDEIIPPLSVANMITDENITHEESIIVDTPDVDVNIETGLNIADQDTGIISGLNIADQDIEMLNDDIFREDYDELVDYEERIEGLNLQNVRLQNSLNKKSKKYKKLRKKYKKLASKYDKRMKQIKSLKQSIVDNSAVKTIPIEITKEIEVVERIDFKKLKKILGDKLPTIRSKKIKKASMVKGKPEVKKTETDKKKKE
jgi:chromosome segregation ATPase